MKTRIIVLLITAGMIVIWNGCASRKEIIRFQEDLVTIENQLIEVQSQNAELLQEVDNLKKSMTTLRDENRRTRADIIAELSSFREQTAFLRNQLDDTGSRMSRLIQNVEGYTPSQVRKDTVKAPDTQVRTSREPDPRELYDAAYQDLSRKNYDLALSGFVEYLRRFPQSEFADNAQYWIGEIYYVRNEYEKALDEFLKIEKNYPAGRKLPSSLLKAGYCYQRLQNPEAAKRLFQRIVSQYPSSEESNLAKERLKQM